MSLAVGVPHPALITCADIDLLDGNHHRTGLGELYGYAEGGGCLGDELARDLREVLAQQD